MVWRKSFPNAMARKKRAHAARDADATPNDGTEEPSFVLDTQSASVPSDLVVHQDSHRSTYSAGDSNDDSHQADESGLDLPKHVAFVPEDVDGSLHANLGEGDYEQLDADGSRYYEREASDERKRRGVCPVCGEMGHDKKKCPYQQVRCFM